MLAIIIWMDRLIHPFFVEREWRINRSIVSCLVTLCVFHINALDIYVYVSEKRVRETWVSLVMNIRCTVGWITNRPMNIVASRKEVPFAASRNKVRHILPPVATPSLFHNDSIRRKRIHRSAFDRENHTKSLFFLFSQYQISDTTNIDDI